jgi:hypothetical protein
LIPERPFERKGVLGYWDKLALGSQNSVEFFLPSACVSIGGLWPSLDQLAHPFGEKNMTQREK